MKTIVVTGGCGFIGSNFVRHLVENHNDIFVINIDKLTYAGNIKNLSNIDRSKNYKFIRGDICNSNLIKSIFKQGVDCVVNFAAESHVDRSIEDSKMFVQTNILGTQTLLDLSLKYGIEKYIQISTDEVYGSLPLDSSTAFSEDTPIAPRNPYSASKAGADMLVRAYYQTYGLPAIITRCTNNYGPYQYPEKLIPKTIINAINEKPIGVYGDGLNVRDWIHVRDHCSAILTVLEQGIAGEIYNIGADNEIANIDIVKLILKHLNKSEKLIQYVTDRPGHDRRYAMNAKKIREQLMWVPQVKFSEGIRETIEWYKSNQNWWARLL
ncbi:MAG: dTDP-glucose 4,6-dehydratase [Clostridiales bacterium]|jgi:dTDP-glucose 4,6-dehydratase|nr:dTDP-glucose 4,6-dehydratase [Clostridiales bacterium]MDK2932696.1 dTDP-glucose 4,6-dehydratase [Clostridiales bacterium]